jgi:hypothetical protein
MWRATSFVLALSLGPAVAHADLVPAGKKQVPRHIEIRDLDRARDDVLVLSECTPAPGLDFFQDYCVLESSGPFRLVGTAWFVPKKRIRLVPVKSSKATPDLPAAVRIQEAANLGVATGSFFRTTPFVRSTRVRAVDSTIIPARSDIIRITDVWRVTNDANGSTTLEADKTIFHCWTGEKLERTLPRDPLRDSFELPACPRESAKPAPSAPSSQPSATPTSETQTKSSSFPELAVALGVGFLLIGAVAALASRKRAT